MVSDDDVCAQFCCGEADEASAAAELEDGLVGEGAAVCEVAGEDLGAGEGGARTRTWGRGARGRNHLTGGPGDAAAAGGRIDGEADGDGDRVWLAGSV